MLRPWQLSLGDRIDPAHDVPIYMQIIQALIRDIERGRLTSGAYLPSSRELATMLGVNRKTVVLAYEDLIAQGWLDSAGTRGTMVSASLPEPANKHRAEAEATMSTAPIDYRFATPPERPLALPSRPRPQARRRRARRATVPCRVARPRLSLRRPSRLARQPASSIAIRAARPRCARASRRCSRASAACRSPPRISASPAAARTASSSPPHVLVQPGDTVIVEALTYEPAVAAFRALRRQ